MIDEHLQEQAALYAFDLLEERELFSFETALAINPSLRSFVRELQETASAMAHLSPTVGPPSLLRSRVLASINRPSAAQPEPIVPFSKFSLRPWYGWAAAACFALSAAWLGLQTVSSRSESSLLRNNQALSAISLQSANQRLEAERILARRQLELHSNQLASLTEQVGSLKARTADLTSQLQAEGDLARLKITALASLLKNSPQALAVAVWNPQKQAGILKVEKLPALAHDQDYQLWVVDPQYPNPVDGGVFAVDAQTGDAYIQFYSKQQVTSVNAFAVTLERKGGVPKAEGPFVLLGK